MKCRFLDLPIEDGFTNTAFEKVLLENTEASQGFTIAFTSWKPTVLIGNSQRLGLDVDQETCEDWGIPIVRRFSGGQAVFIDENYIVVNVFGPRAFFPVSLTEKRKDFCEVIIRALNQFGIPVNFYWPDNIVVSFPRIRTLGNSGQFLKAKAIWLQGSIRYELTEKSLKKMLAVLKTNGQSLQSFYLESKDALASLKEFTNADKSEIKEALFEKLLSHYGCESFEKSTPLQSEIGRLKKIRESLKERVKDREKYASRGVCYFYLNGQCIVPEIAAILPSNKPSTHLDSTIT